MKIKIGFPKYVKIRDDIYILPALACTSHSGYNVKGIAIGIKFLKKTIAICIMWHKNVKK